MRCDEVKPLLNGHLDGEIDPARSSAMDAHLSACSSCAADFHLLESVRDRVRTGASYHRAPAGLDDRVRFALRGAEYLDGGATHGRNWKTWGAVAAAVTLVVLASAPFLVNSRNHRELLAEELVSAHERAMMGHAIDVVSSDQHTVKPWFSGRVPFSPPVTDLAVQGFALEGGRMDYIAGHPVAVLVYRRRLHRIDVFVWPFSGETPPSNFGRNGYNEVGWRKNDFVFSAISDLNAGELSGFASLLQNLQ